jgi:YD repeat-containing protein
MNLEDDANNRLISMTDAAGSTAFGYTGRRGQASGSVLSIRRTECD